MRVAYLVRHGEPALTGVLLGRMDPGLSAAGRAAARAALAGLRAAIAYVSPLRRALETAEFLPGDIERRILPDLIEVGQGDWEGLRWDEIEARDPELARTRLARWLEVPAPRGEPWAHVLARARAAAEIVSSGPLPAVVVAHHGINSALAHVIAGVDPAAFVQAYCEVIPYEL